MEMQPTRASSRLRKNNSMDDLCTGIATKCKPYTLDQSKAMNKKEKACDKDYTTTLGQNLIWPHMNFLKTNFLQQ
jgi:ribosomal protein L25 (general stress protein Ctc)